MQFETLVSISKKGYAKYGRGAVYFSTRTGEVSYFSLKQAHATAEFMVAITSYDPEKEFVLIKETSLPFGGSVYRILVSHILLTVMPF